MSFQGHSEGLVGCSTLTKSCFSRFVYGVGCYAENHAGLRKLGLW